MFDGLCDEACECARMSGDAYTGFAERERSFDHRNPLVPRSRERRNGQGRFRKFPKTLVSQAKSGRSVAGRGGPRRAEPIAIALFTRPAWAGGVVHAGLAA